MTEESKKQKELREFYVSKGFCQNGCGNQIAETSKSRCSECLAKAAESMKLTKYSRIASGLCGRGCGRKLSSTTLCDKCLAKARKYTKKWSKK